MRPLRLVVEGLSCFRERQEIDFADLDLFAITGPTGAGKSTLLDAMVLALYGAIPRMGKRRLAEMIAASRDRASVVLDFEVGEARYRVARTLRRSGTGNQAQLDGHDGDDYAVNLAHQARAVDAKVAELLGLDLTSFTQAIVLPQGEFAAFLKADPAKQGDMLRSLLRLDIYERMAERAKSRRNQAENEAKHLRHVLGEEYEDVEEAAVAATAERASRAEETLVRLRNEREAATRAHERVRQQHAWTVELEVVDARAAELDAETSEVEALRERLDAARRATPILHLIEAADVAASDAAGAEARSEAARTSRETAGAIHAECVMIQEAATAAAAALAGHRELISRLERAAGRLPELRQIEQDITGTEAETGRLREELGGIETGLESAAGELAEFDGKVAAARQAVADAGYDGPLDATLAAVRDQAVRLGMTRAAADHENGRLTRAREALELLESRLDVFRGDRDDAAAMLAKAVDAARAAEHALHAAHRADAANHLREGLHAGEACPVCEQIVASPPATSADPAVEAAAAERDQAESARAEAARVEATTTQALAQHESAIAARRAEVEEISARCGEQAAEIAALDADLRAEVRAAMGESDVAVEVWIEQAVAETAERRRRHEAAGLALRKAEAALMEMQSAIESTQLRGEAIKKDITRAERALADDSGRRDTIAKEIAEVCPSGDPEGEITKLAAEVARIEAASVEAADRMADAKAGLSGAEAALASASTAYETAAKRKVDTADRRDAALADAGFVDADGARSAAVDAATSAEGEARIRTHEQGLVETAGRQADLIEKLGETRIEENEVVVARQAVEDADAAVDEAIAESTRLAQSLDSLKARLKRAEAMRAQLDKAEGTNTIYRQLASDLQRNGFPMFVLQEAFIDLLRGASSRLSDLTGERYQLRYYDGEILVVDNDNAGETRVSDTLSGGETFLASLALALELSVQVQRAAGAVHLDSLFIDEGFGTLDPETLSLVADTLQGLQVGGRLVGIITHIPELRDEFDKQIVVHKRQGHSTVEVALGGALQSSKD